VIRWPARIFVATTPTNLHLSFDRLAGIVREYLGNDPRAEAIFMFHNRRRTHIKILWHNGRGYCLFYMRLDRGTYRIPTAIPPEARSVQVTERELSLLLEGIDRGLLRAARRTAAKVESESITSR
jgi:transposase